MALEIRQVQKLAQQLVMTPQLQQAIKLLQLSRVELEEMVLKELQENPALEEGQVEESENAEQPRNEVSESIPGVEAAEVVLNRELSAVDKIGTLDWQEYLDTHSNSIHGSLTAEATSEDGDSPPSWENSLTKENHPRRSPDLAVALVQDHRPGVRDRPAYHSEPRRERIPGSWPRRDLQCHGEQPRGIRNGLKAHPIL